MIVPMKKAEIAVLAEDRERLLASLQRSGTLMLIKTTEDALAGDASGEDALAARTEKTLRLLDRFRQKHESEEVMHPAVDYGTFAAADPARIELLKTIESLDEEIVRLKAEGLTLSAERVSLLPWSDLEIAPAVLGRSGSVVLHAGFVPPARLASVAAEAASEGAEFQTYGTAPEGVAAVLAVYYEDDTRVAELLRAAGFTETILPASPEPIRTLIAARETEIAANAAMLLEAEERLRGHARHKLQIELLNDQAITAGERKKAPVTETASAAFIEGWVRSDRLDALRKALDDAADVYELGLSDPAAGEVPPTAVKNNRFVSAFETITDMFARPSYGEIDPNPVMSIWYWLLFGMMMADVGYGIVMILLFTFLIRKMRAKGETLKLLKVLKFSGYTTVFWGLLFNSYFGASIGFMDWLRVLNPVEDTMLLLGISLGVGVLHIFTGLLMKAANNARKKDYVAIFADSLAWILLISGLAMLLLPSLVTVPGGDKIAAAGKWIAIAGAGIIVLFAGRASRNPVARIGSGLYALYGVTGYLGDIMSYSRVLALALTSAIIGQVMNQLAGMVQGDAWYGIFFAIPIYLVGHVFNLVMGLLSAYVHTSRLQFIEFYTKFYEGAGYEFRPLAVQLKYIDVVNDANN